MGVVAVVVLGLAIFYFTGSKKTEYEFALAAKGEVVDVVSVTGRVQPAEGVDLSFETGGRVARVNFAVGDKVRAGNAVMELANGDLAAGLSEARASADVQKAKLDELTRGTRAEEMAVYETKVANAEASLNDARRNLYDKINDAYTKSDDGVRNHVDQLFSNAKSATPKVIFVISDSQLKSDVEWGRFVTETALTSWNSSLLKMSLSGSLDDFSTEASKNLNTVKNFLDKMATAVNSLSANTSMTQTTIDGWRADLATARTNVNTAITNLSTAVEKMKTAESTLDLARNDLALKRAGSAPEAIRAQEAAVAQAEAGILVAQAKLAKTVLRSPFGGILTKSNFKVGEFVSSNAIAVSIISEASFEVEVNVPEADMAKVKIGDTANITLDAYGSDIIFPAQVTKIDPAETMIEGVATYKTTLQFKEKDERVKSGMTANIDILAAERKNVIAVPRRAVIARNGDKIVRVLDENDNMMEVAVKTGLYGSGGNVEILEGIDEGDLVVTFIKN